MSNNTVGKYVNVHPFNRICAECGDKNAKPLSLIYSDRSYTPMYSLASCEKHEEQVYALMMIQHMKDKNKSLEKTKSE
jgi:hypothetical protein